MEEQYVTITEAAAILGVSREKVRRLIEQGKLEARPSVLDARQKLIRRSDVDAFRNQERPA